MSNQPQASGPAASSSGAVGLLRHLSAVQRPVQPGGGVPRLSAPPPNIAQRPAQPSSGPSGGSVAFQADVLRRLDQMPLRIAQALSVVMRGGPPHATPAAAQPPPAQPPAPPTPAPPTPSVRPRDPLSLLRGLGAVGPLFARAADGMQQVRDVEASVRGFFGWQRPLPAAASPSPLAPAVPVAPTPPAPAAQPPPRPPSAPVQPTIVTPPLPVATIATPAAGRPATGTPPAVLSAIPMPVRQPVAAQPTMLARAAPAVTQPGVAPATFARPPAPPPVPLAPPAFAPARGLASPGGSQGAGGLRLDPTTKQLLERLVDGVEALVRSMEQPGKGGQVTPGRQAQAQPLTQLARPGQPLPQAGLPPRPDPAARFAAFRSLLAAARAAVK